MSLWQNILMVLALTWCLKNNFDAMSPNGYMHHHDALSYYTLSIFINSLRVDTFKYHVTIKLMGIYDRYDIFKVLDCSLNCSTVHNQVINCFRVLSTQWTCIISKGIKFSFLTQHEILDNTTMKKHMFDCFFCFKIQMTNFVKCFVNRFKVN